jgi:hypothetical protein
VVQICESHSLQWTQAATLTGYCQVTRTCCSMSGLGIPKNAQLRTWFLQMFTILEDITIWAHMVPVLKGLLCDHCVAWNISVSGRTWKKQKGTPLRPTSDCGDEAMRQSAWGCRHQNENWSGEGKRAKANSGS